MNQATRQISEKFFADPEWGVVEKLIMEYVDGLLDINTLDTSVPPEELKAELKGRLIAREKLMMFLQDTKLIARETTKPTTFK